MICELLVALRFLVVHAPGGQEIDINVEEVASLHEPREEGSSLVTPGTGCLIYMSSGKFIPVTETCHDIRAALERDK